MNHTEPKPQTPLTDAKNRELARAILPDGGTPEDGYFGMMEHARSLELKLQEAQLTIENLKKVLNEQAL